MERESLIWQDNKLPFQAVSFILIVGICRLPAMIFFVNLYTFYCFSFCHPLLHLMNHSTLFYQDIDTIYLSQDSTELCLNDFDHLEAKWVLLTFFAAFREWNFSKSPSGFFILLSCTSLLFILFCALALFNVVDKQINDMKQNYCTPYGSPPGR